jgi:hypothetical protein
VSGRHTLLWGALLLENEAVPLDDRAMLPTNASYSLYWKGSAMPVEQSSQWLPMSVKVCKKPLPT